jgi:methylase of polypeptide subunit release factors
MPGQTAEIQRFSVPRINRERSPLPNPELRPDLYVRMNFTVDTQRLGLLDASLPGKVDPRISYQQTLSGLQQDGIRHSVGPQERQNDGSDGRYNFDLAVPRSGLEGITTQADRLIAVRAHVMEKVVDAMGLGDNVVTVKEWGGRKFFVPVGVFPPSTLGQEFSTGVMSDHRQHIVGGHVLDVGTGSGILAVAAGLMGADRVTATDLNPSAITAAKVSWALNGLDPDRLDTVEADSLKGFIEAGPQFSMIVANPPVQPLLETNSNNLTARDTWQAWNEGGSNGNEVLLDILEQGLDLLEPDGIILTTTSSRHGHATTKKVLESIGASGDVILERELPLGPQYEKYIPIWESQQDADGDPRIWQENDGQYFHRFMVLRVGSTLNDSQQEISSLLTPTI